MSSQSTIKPVVSNKPYSVPIEMRPLWRISLLIATIGTLGGENRYVSFKKVNMLVWMLIRQSRWSEYESYLSLRSFDLPLVSTDTATYKAVEFALAKRLISLDSGRLHITEYGMEHYALLVENGVMSDEISFLENVGRKLTDKRAKAILEGLI